MTGRLGAYDLTGGLTQSVYQGDTEKFTAVTLNITNRNNTPVTVSVGITQTQNTINSDEYIEYGLTIPAKGSLERSGIIVPTEDYLTVFTTHNNVSAVAWGVRTGADLSLTPIVTATTATAPTWVTPATFNWPDIDILNASDLGYVAYTITSGNLPAGLSLRENGEIIGSTTIGLTTSATISATNPSGLSSSRAFTITTTATTGHRRISE